MKKSYRLSKLVLLVCLLFQILSFAQDEAPFKHEEKIKKMMKNYFKEVDDKDIDGMFKYFKLPLTIHIDHGMINSIESRDDFDDVFHAWKNSPSADFHSTRIDSMTITEIKDNFNCVADVAYSRLDDQGNVINRQRVLYHYVRTNYTGPWYILNMLKISNILPAKWGIYMLSNIELEGKTTFKN